MDARGYYNGTFQAIAADTGFLPRPKFEQPHAESQFAKVIDNADPLNQGRVQVRFDWQLHDTTEWIHVMTPDGGGSDKVSKNRGFMAIPEVGDQVMVDFVHDNPDRPFVLGGMFHGKVGGGGGAGNNVKSLSSKSGNKLELNDAAGSVHLTDKGGSNMTFDGGGNAVINANSAHSINAGSSHTTGVGGKKDAPPQSLLQMDAGGNITLDGKTSITLKVGKNSITISAEGISASAGTGTIDITALAGALSMKSSGGEMGITTDSALTITGGPTAVMSSGDTNIM